MKKFKLTIAYDGTQYGGWQVQPNTVSIQELIEKALSTFLREPISIVGSGRTDAGVHAEGQTAHFTTTSSVDRKRLLLSVNALLPHDIRIMDAVEAPSEFHARFDAAGKIYHYRLHLVPVNDPFKRLYSYHIPYALDLDSLRKAVRHFIGTHDFSSFANEGDRGSAGKNPVRTLHRLDVVEEEGGIRLEFEGEGFLYKMVRNIVGALLDVARGKISEEEITAIFAARDRRVAPMAAPAHGLCLIKVLYAPYATLNVNR